MQERELFRFKGYLFNFKYCYRGDMTIFVFWLLFLSPFQQRNGDKDDHNKCCYYGLYLTNYSLLVVYLTTLLAICDVESQRYAWAGLRNNVLLAACCEL